MFSNFYELMSVGLRICKYSWIWVWNEYGFRPDPHVHICWGFVRLIFSAYGSSDHTNTVHSGLNPEGAPCSLPINSQFESDTKSLLFLFLGFFSMKMLPSMSLSFPQGFLLDLLLHIVLLFASHTRQSTKTSAPGHMEFISESPSLDYLALDSCYSGLS